MISDLDETLRQILIAELPVKNGEIEISFDQPKREWSSRLTRPTVNMFLYDIRENPSLRQHQWEPSANFDPGHTATFKRSPLRVDCFYMMTTWAAEPEDEHLLMSRCMLALFRHSVLPKEKLVGEMQHQAFEIPARLANHDKLTNPAEIWSALDNEMRPSISYLVTLAMEPWQEVSGPVVRSLLFRTGQAGYLPDKRTLLPEGQTESAYVGGIVHDAAGAPQAGLRVAVKNTGFIAETDALGRFVLGSLLPGTYDLVIWLLDGRITERRVQVPSSEGLFDFTI